MVSPKSVVLEHLHVKIKLTHLLSEANLWLNVNVSFIYFVNIHAHLTLLFDVES